MATRAMSFISCKGSGHEGTVHCAVSRLESRAWLVGSTRISHCPQSLQAKSSTLPRMMKHAQANASKIQMTLTVERPIVTKPTSSPLLAYDLVQGTLVRWSEVRDKSTPEPPTAVFLHGMLGSRKNWASFTRRMAQAFPAWQFLLVDLRCHGDSSEMPGSHTVSSAARDVLKLLWKLKLTPRVLVGHSFGGKVVLSMIEHAAKPLARPVQAWILDATPGKVHAGGHGEDRPAELIAALHQMPAKVPSRQYVIDALVDKGFSPGVAQWMTTNLRQIKEGSSSRLAWTFDLDGIGAMYKSYEDTNLWALVDDVPEGVHLNFLRAERSLHRWAHEDIQRIHAAELAASNEGAGVELHVLEDAGHWVHADNPEGLFRTLAPSFTGYLGQYSPYGVTENRCA